MAFLADVAFLVPLLHAAHAHSARATTWLRKQDAAGSIVICRVTQMGALRVLTNRAFLREDVLTTSEFWNGWDRVVGDDRFIFSDEPPRLEEVWRRLTTGWARGRMAETDSYLAAFALAGGYGIVSFDRGLKRFPELALEVP